MYSEILKIYFVDVETTQRIKTRSTRAVSQEPLPFIARKSPKRSIRGKSEEPPSVITESSSSHLLSPRRTSLRISSRKSLRKSVSETALQNPVKDEHSESPHKQSLLTDISSTSSLPSEEFDRLYKQQPFDLSNIVLSPMQYTTSFESSVSTVSITSEHNISKPTIAAETQSETSKTEKKQSRRSSIRLKSRKSLSRMVLERNACLYTSTPHHSFLDNSDKDISEKSRKEPSIFEVSEMHLSEQEELDRLIEKHNVDMPNYSLSIDMPSVSSDVSSEKQLLETDGVSMRTIPAETCTSEKSITRDEFALNEELEHSTNSNRTEGIVTNKQLNDLKAPGTLSIETSCNFVNKNQSEIHETVSLKLDEVNTKADAVHNDKEATETMEIATINEIHKSNRTDLSELEKESDNSCLPIEIENTDALEGTYIS